LLPYAWADLSAQFEGSSSASGVAVFQHPANRDFPAGWCLRYYGFLGVAWPGLEVADLQPGEPLTLVFRIWIHDGSAEQGAVSQAYDVYQSHLSF
jgi:hypothetical protein